MRANHLPSYSALLTRAPYNNYNPETLDEYAGNYATNISTQTPTPTYGLGDTIGGRGYLPTATSPGGTVGQTASAEEVVSAALQSSSEADATWAPLRRATWGRVLTICPGTSRELSPESSAKA